MDEVRLKNAISAVKNTQAECKELAARCEELASRLEQLPAVPQLSARFLLTLALLFALAGVVIGTCLWLL